MSFALSVPKMVNSLRGLAFVRQKDRSSVMRCACSTTAIAVEGNQGKLGDHFTCWFRSLAGEVVSISLVLFVIFSILQTFARDIEAPFLDAFFQLHVWLSMKQDISS